MAIGLTSFVGAIGSLVTGGGSDALAGWADSAEGAAILGPILATFTEAIEFLGDASWESLTDALLTAATDAPALRVVNADVASTAQSPAVTAALDREMERSTAVDTPASLANQAQVAEAVEITPQDLSVTQAGNYRRYMKKLPAGAEEPTVTALPNGNVLFEAKVPGRVPGSYAIYSKQIDNTGKTVDYNKTTVDPQGKIVHVKNKMPS